MHLTRLRRFTEPSKSLSPTALCGQVMASVIRIWQAVNRNLRLVPIGSTIDA